MGRTNADTANSCALACLRRIKEDRANLKKANISDLDDAEVQKIKTIGFLKDRRRMNVSLSRARLTLAVVG
ncbi:MAG: AAA domain-containing protein, partial [Pseudomonadota bacterium]|nr:AAA domain-containing protein [Pseudomonadota bacterium]